MRLVRQHERQRFDKMRRRLQQNFALGKRLGDESEFVIFEIAQAPVDQFRAPRRRVLSKIVALDQQHGQATTRGVARNAGAVDAAADHQQVVGPVVHAISRAGFYRMGYDLRSPEAPAMP